MAEYGVTTEGFVQKRLDEIKLEIETNLIASYGEIDTSPESVFGQLIGVFSNALSETWEQMAAIYYAMYPNSAEGVNLDNSASYVGVERLGSTSTTVPERFKAIEGVSIPANTQVKQSATNIVFETDSVLLITKASCQVIEIIVDTVVVGFNYTIDLDDSTDLLQINYTALVGDTKADIITGLYTSYTALSTALKALYTNDYVITNEQITFTYALTEVTDSMEATYSSNLVSGNITCATVVSAIIKGKTPAVVGSVNTIVNPVTGLESVTNVVEGTQGRELETDTALRVRRRNNLQVISACTLLAIRARIEQDLDAVTKSFVFENRTDLVDANGLAPHSFKVVVAAEETTVNSQTVGDKIWELKPAGIATNGDVSVDVTDSNGDNQEIKFSYAKTKYVYVSLTYDKTDADSAFPTNGESAIEQAILDLGDSFTFGSDLLIQVFETTGYVAGGVTAVTIELAISDNPSDPSPIWQASNIKINSADLPSLDTTRIYISEA